MAVARVPIPAPRRPTLRPVAWRRNRLAKWLTLLQGQKRRAAVGPSGRDGETFSAAHTWERPSGPAARAVALAAVLRWLVRFQSAAAVVSRRTAARLRGRLG